MDMILASASPRRAELLHNLGLSFVIQPAQFDEESLRAESPFALVEALSSAKAQLVAGAHKDALVLAADTVVVLDGDILEKPKNEAEAQEMLSRLAGHWHEVYTGVSLQLGDRCHSFHEKTKVHFRPLSPQEIDAYIQTGEPFDKAGGYGIQGFGALLVDQIQGDYFNVMGLPLCALGQAMENFGLGLEQFRMHNEKPCGL